jgi:hypothetical protein
MITRAQLGHVGRRARVGAAALLTGLALTGCIQLDQRFEVQNDGSVKADIILALDKEQLALLSSFGEGLSTDTTIKGKRTTPTTKAPDPCAELVIDSKKGAGAGATVLPYKSGKFCGARIRQTIPPGGDIKAKINGILESSDDAMGDDSEDDPFFDSLTLKKAGSGWELNARIGALQDESADDESAALAATFLKDAKIIVRFKLPGKVSTHNATSVEKDGTLVWNIDLFSSKATVIKAKSSG